MKYDERQEIYAGQLRQVYRRHSVGLIANVLISSILVFIQWNVIPHPVLIIWFSALILMTLAKYLLLYRYRHSIVTPAQSYRWGSWFIAGVLITGLIWGSAGIFLFPPGLPVHQIFIAFVLAGMVAGAVGTYSALEKAFLAFSIPALAPLIIKFFYLGGQVHVAMGIMTLFFAILMIATSRRSYKTTTASLKLLFENKNLIEYLTESKERAENLNLQLESEIEKKNKAEAELKKHQEHLESLVEERTKELKASEEKYGIVVNNANDAIFIIQDGRYKFPNPKFLEATGYSLEELADLPFEKIIHPRDREQVTERYKRRISGEDIPNIYTCRIITKSGKEIFANINAVRILWEGRPAGMYFCRDITERIKLEDRLRLAQKLEAIGTLAGGIAHNFNNILMSIQGNISLILREISPGNPYHRLLQNTERSIASGARLTKQLLGFARGESYEVKPTNLNELLQNTVSLFGQSRQEIRVHPDYGEDIRPVEVDPSQMEQVFLNLCINAGQAMPEGGELYLKTRNIKLDQEAAAAYELKPGEYVQITIIDTGNGMDRETQEKIFDPFFTTREVNEGTGLGMASAYGIIRSHGGGITVSSELGRGTTFLVCLPASEKAIKPEKQPPAGILTSTGTVLLVEDEEQVLKLIKQYLQLLGFDVLAALNGEEALRIYRENQADIKIVILDMIMPGFSGIKIYQALREINPRVKVLLSSGYSIEGEASKILASGCNGFIQKPFSVEHLSQKLQWILSRGERRAVRKTAPQNK